MIHVCSESCGNNPIVKNYTISAQTIYLAESNAKTRFICQTGRELTSMWSVVVR